MNIEKKVLDLNTLQTGDIYVMHSPLVWYKPKSWLSALIRMFTKSYWNHAGIFVSDWGVIFANEAEATGIITSPAKDRFKGLTILIRRPKAPIDEKMFAVKVNYKVGVTGYDFSGILFYQIIYQLTGHWLGTNSKEKAEKRMYCSEYVGWAYNTDKWWEVVPRDIASSDLFEDIWQGEVSGTV